MCQLNNILNETEFSTDRTLCMYNNKTHFSSVFLSMFNQFCRAIQQDKQIEQLRQV